MSSANAQGKGAPIYFLQQGDQLTETAERSPITPVVRILLQPALPSSPFDPIPGAPLHEMTALIDTGAEGVYIDEDFANQNGFLSERTMTVHSASATTIEPVYPALFILQGSSTHYKQAAEFTSVPLRKNGRHYDAILGMQFLSNGVLVMDFDSHTYRFEFTTQANK
ncbi:retropepsin-like aspartic protease [Pseudomonas putida]|uniref:retropepsin-like aspartic protease n=1 Tax=Pseudomonas putida TaxID=303 RepID=UPI00064C8678|nr:retropepsin-like aspartic protease [Pseudomonas putida]